MENCIFCKIINGEIPSYKVYEDQDFLAILDISQTTKGHTLVIPKKHTTNLLDTDRQTIEQAYGVATDIAKKLVSKLNADGVNIIQNNNEVAGQTVFHFHIHIIPRYDDKNNDSIDIKFHSTKQDFDQLLKDIND